MSIPETIHKFKCFCGRSYTTSIDLEDHRIARGHFPSHRCTSLCKHPSADPHDGKIRYCGHCGKECERLDIFQDHVIATGHCFCSECDLTFSSRQSWEVHCKTAKHASEFKCCDCNIFFKDFHALVAHMESRAHRKPVKSQISRKRRKASVVASTNTECTKCRRKFSSSQSLQQHYASVKHKPLSDLRCPVGTGCRGTFTSPSALLHHLESGKCSSGINRDDVYQMSKACDPEGIIHTQLVSVATTLPIVRACAPPIKLELGELYSGSESEWSLLTPDQSQDSVNDSLEQWLLLEGSQTQFEETVSFSTATVQKLQCPVCQKAQKGFANMHSLQQHMCSSVHSPKGYHCPGSLSNASLGQGSHPEKCNGNFSTLSGLCQHLESGSCQDGKRTFLRCMDLVQGQLEQLGLGKMQLVLPDI